MVLTCPPEKLLTVKEFCVIMKNSMEPNLFLNHTIDCVKTGHVLCKITN